MKDVKKRHLEETAAKKLEEKRLKEEDEQIKAEYEKHKSNWREDLKESGWTPVAGSIANSTSQTFNYSVPNFETGEPNTFTVSGLGGVESLPSSVKVDFGFGESPPDGVNPPSYNQLALAGYAKPILMKRRDTEEVNPRLDASQEFAQKVGADVMMNARVKTGEKPDEWYRNRQKTGYYTKKLGPIHGAMTDLRELKMNERLVQENERQYEIYKKNDAIRAEHQKIIDKKIEPHLDKINSGLDKKIDLRTLYQRGAVVNDDGTRGLMIRRETKSSMGLSLTKTVITSYTGKNLSTVGSVANREKLGITGQGKMTKVAEIKDPRLIEYKMPLELEMWQSQGVDPKGAITRSVGAPIAAKVGVKSAFDVLNYYIDNHVLTNAQYDPARANVRHNLTHLITDRTKDILQKGMNELKPKIDAEIEKYKAMIPKIGEKQARYFLELELLGDEYNDGLINSYFRSDSTINNTILQKIQRVDIFNSLGNNLGFDIDHYMKTGNYGFNSTYNFTSTLDMGVRVPYVGGVTSILSRKYVSGQLYGETMMAVQNPMQFRVDIESGKKYEQSADSSTEDAIGTDKVKKNQGTFDKDGNYIPPGYEDAIGTDEIKNLGRPPVYGKVEKGVYDLSNTYADGSSEAEVKAGYEKARKGIPSLPPFSELTSNIEPDNIPEPNEPGWTYDEYIEMLNAVGDRASAAESPIVKEILRYGPGGDKTGDVPEGLVKGQETITIAAQKAMDRISRAWERYNKIPDLSGYGMDPSRDTETEPRPVRGGQGGRRLGSTTRRQGGAYNPSSIGFDRNETPFRNKKKNVRGSGARGGRKGRVNESNTLSKIKKILKEKK